MLDDVLEVAFEFKLYKGEYSLKSNIDKQHYRIIVTNPQFVIDTKENTIQEIDIDVKQYQQLASAPKISKEDIRKVVQGVGQALPDLVVKTPKSIKITKVKVKPTPRLHLKSNNSFVVDFSYENYNVRYAPQKELKTFYENGEKVELTRNLKSELQARETLENIGFKVSIKDDNLSTMDDIEDIVMKLRKRWNLGFDPIYNIVEMLELKNIKVLLLNDDKKFNGLSGHANNNSSHQFIVLNINKALSDDRKRFTALHELGHQLLPQHELDEEKASDRFAGAFLFPKESVIKEFGEKRTKISFEELKHIKYKYGISIAGIIFRMHQLHIISDAMFKRFWIQNRTAKFDDKVILKRDEKVTRFENLLAHAYSEKLISLSKLSELSGESVDDALVKYGEMI